MCWPSLTNAQVGMVQGVVRDAATTAPLQDVDVFICGTGGCQSATTGVAGSYAFSPPAGTYYAFTRNSIGYTNEIHGDLLCPGQCQAYIAETSGTPIVVVSGQQVTVNFALDRGAVISGTVTAGGTPLAGVTVRAVGITTSSPFVAAEAQTDSAGAYSIRGLPTGRYYAATANDLGFVDEIYDNVPCLGWCSENDFEATATPIDVALGATAADRDFALEGGGRITGTVTDAATSSPVDDVCVVVVTVVGGVLRFAGYDCADGSGTYEVGMLPTGTYYLAIDPFTTRHIPEMYDDIPCHGYSCILELPGATPIQVSVGATTTGRDFVLNLGGAIRGVVRDAMTSDPLGWVGLSVFSRDGDSVAWVGYAETDVSGEYLVAGLPGGTYYAIAERDRYRDEIFDDIQCPAEQCTLADLLTLGTPIAVTAGGVVTSGIDFSLRGDIPPGAPRELRATVGGYNVSLSWSPPYSGASATGYVIEAGLTPGTTIVSLASTTTSYVASGVAPGRYYVRVRAVNAYGTGPASEEREVVVSANGSAPPGAPERVTGWMSGQRLTLTWADAPEGGTPSSYVVEAGSATGVTNIAVLPVGTRALTYIPVPAGFYFVRVRAVNAAGSSPPSTEILLNSGFVAAPPEAPRGLEYAVAGSSVTLTWHAPASGAPTRYLIRAGSAPRLSNLAQLDTGSAATTAVVGGVPPGTYYVRVHAVNALGASVASNEVVVVVP